MYPDRAAASRAGTAETVDLDALAHNYRLLRGLDPKAKFLGLVKADAYGHGAAPIAKKLQELGADMLAVACLDEAIVLRESGIALPILRLGQRQSPRSQSSPITS